MESKLAAMHSKNPDKRQAYSITRKVLLLHLSHGVTKLVLSQLEDKSCHEASIKPSQDPQCQTV